MVTFSRLCGAWHLAVGLGLATATAWVVEQHLVKTEIKCTSTLERGCPRSSPIYTKWFRSCCLLNLVSHLGPRFIYMGGFCQLAPGHGSTGSEFVGKKGPCICAKRRGPY